MSQTPDNPTGLSCPRCRRPMPNDNGKTARCECGWSGQAWRFQPVPHHVAHASEALDDDVVCVHHPDKRAVAVCAGTGNYICSLCAATIGSKVYSVQYIDRVGLDDLGQPLAPLIPRPERTVMWLWLGAYLTFIFLGIPQLIAAGAGVYFYARMFIQRSRYKLYAELVGPSRIALATACLFLTLLLAGVWVFVWVTKIMEWQQAWLMR